MMRDLTVQFALGQQAASGSELRAGDGEEVLLTLRFRELDGEEAARGESPGEGRLWAYLSWPCWAIGDCFRRGAGAVYRGWSERVEGRRRSRLRACPCYLAVRGGCDASSLAMELTFW